ncbi:MAG: M23 family metallopeptidase [Pseudanabaenaceae cyanobacterium bins.39]|nr:M23 family metallopeptidase [Pseudanabaenaceae cyanobacterium bins.39]
MLDRLSPYRLRPVASRKSYWYLGLGLLSAIASILIGVSQAEALQVMFKPTAPRLGDTISVWISSDASNPNPPTITMDNRQFPAFVLAPNRWRALIPTTPLDKAGTKQIAVTIDGKPQLFAITLANRQFPTQRLWINESGGGLEPTDAEWNAVSAFKKLVTPEKFWQGAFLRPNEGEVTTEFGVQRYYNGVFADDYYHRGVDYAGGYGSPVIAPASGYIRLVGTVAQGYRLHGNTIGLDHGQGVLSIFLHLSKIYVQEGDFVKAGQVIGAVGATGASTGPHLHWGLYVNGEAVDPVAWRYEGIE